MGNSIDSFVQKYVQPKPVNSTPPVQKPTGGSSIDSFVNAYKKPAVATTTPKAYGPVLPVAQKKDTVSLYGGGEFYTKMTPQTKDQARDIKTSEKREIAGGNFNDTQNEVDHIIPVALGGTNSPVNLQALKSDKTISQAVKDFITGNKRLPGDYKPKNRQEGKMIVEWQAINDYEAGKITLPQARMKVLNYQNEVINPPKTTLQYLPEATVETVKQAGSLIKTGLNKIGGAIKSVLPKKESESKPMVFDTVKDAPNIHPTNEEILNTGVGPVNYKNLTKESQSAINQFVNKQRVIKPTITPEEQTIKVPFSDKVIGTGESVGQNVLKDLASYLSRTPEKIVNSVAEVLDYGSHDKRQMKTIDVIKEFMTTGPDTSYLPAKEQLYRVKTYQDDIRELLNNGISPLFAGVLMGAQTVGDVSFVYGITKSVLSEAGNMAVSAAKNIPVEQAKKSITTLTYDDLVNIMRGPEYSSPEKVAAFVELNNEGVNWKALVKQAKENTLNVTKIEKPAKTFYDLIKENIDEFGKRPKPQGFVGKRPAEDPLAQKAKTDISKFTDLDEVKKKIDSGVTQNQTMRAEEQGLSIEEATAQANKPRGFVSIGKDSETNQEAEPSQEKDNSDFDIKEYVDMDSMKAKIDNSVTQNQTLYPEKRREERFNDYTKTITSIYNELETIVKTPEQKQILKDSFKRFTDTYNKLYSNYLSASSRPSNSMVVGPAKFNFARNSKLIDMEMKRYAELKDFTERAVNKIKRELLPESQKPITGNTKEAVGKINERSSELEKVQKYLISVNKFARTNGKVEVADALKIAKENDIDITENGIEEKLRLNRLEKNGYPGFVLTSNRSKIKAFQSKLKITERNLNKSEATGGQEEVSSFDNGSIVKNYEADRVQINFTERPDQETITKLKGRGFRWSSTNKAWQRKLTTRAVLDAEIVTNATRKETPATKQVPAEKPDGKMDGERLYLLKTEADMYPNNLDKFIDNFSNSDLNKSQLTEIWKSVNEPAEVKEVVTEKAPVKPEEIKTGNIVKYKDEPYTVLQTWSNGEIDFSRIQNNNTRKIITVKDSELNKTEIKKPAEPVKEVVTEKAPEIDVKALVKELETKEFYHGTTLENKQHIEATGFKPTKGVLGTGVYLTDKESVVKEYNKGGLLTVKVKVENPLVLTKKYDYLEWIKQNDPATWEKLKTSSPKDFDLMNYAENKGFDAVIVKGDFDEIVVPTNSSIEIINNDPAFITEYPIKVYRGDGKGIGNTTFVKGRYLADSKEFASTFGEVTEEVIPKGVKVFDFDKIKNNPDQEVIPKTMLVDPDKLTDYLIKQGFEYTKNTNSRGVEYVKLNKEKADLEELARNSESLSDFKRKLLNDWDSYRDEIRRQELTIKDPDQRMRIDILEKIYYRVKDKTDVVKDNQISNEDSLIEEAKKFSNVKEWNDSIISNLENTSFRGAKVDLRNDNYTLEFKPISKMSEWMAKTPGDQPRIDKIKDSILKGEKMPPVLVQQFGEDLSVIDGHNRVEAYKELGFKEVPTLVILPGKGIGNIVNLEDIWNQANQTKPMTEDSLMEEAKKYKSAEDFVKGRKIVYHGTDSFAADAIQAKGFSRDKQIGLSFTTDKDVAQEFAEARARQRGTKPVVMEVDITDVKNPNYNKFVEGKESEIFVNVDDIINLKTKSQLEDIWNKANSVNVVPEVKLEEIKPEDKIDFKKEKKQPVVIDKVLEKYKENKQTLAELVAERDLLAESLEVDPASELMIYYNQRTGSLPEVSDNWVNVRGKNQQEFARRGDDIANELGYPDSESARRSAENFVQRYEKLKAMNKQIAKLRADVDAKVPVTKYQLELQKNRVTKFKDKLTEVKSRIAKVRALRDYFELSDADMKKISKKDPRFMDNAEFAKFIDELSVKAEELQQYKQAYADVLYTIESLSLRRIENLIQAMGLPKSYKDMTKAQLEQLGEILRQYKPGDEFISVRRLETIDKTPMAGIKTTREAREFFSKRTGIPVDQLPSVIEVNNLIDKVLYEVPLARRNVLFKVIVEDLVTAMIYKDEIIHQTRKEVNTLFNAARRSRPRTMLERFVPQDKRIFDWLSSEDVKKAELAKDMTKEELAAASYVQAYYSSMRDYLIENKVLVRYMQNYVTHLQRDVLEAIKDGGIKTAFKEVLQKRQLEEAVFNIIPDTGEVLPLNVFFKNSMTRTGAISPTKNVAKAFMSYVRNFQNKKALDATVPMLDTFVFIFSPQKLTPRGLIFDASLKRWFNQFINTKKGRAADMLFIQQGNQADRAIRSTVALTRILDLGANIVIGTVSQVGEVKATIDNIGFKKFGLGLKRYNTKQGKFILNKYEAFTGDSIWDKLTDASATMLDKAGNALFMLFSTSARRANRVHLLSVLTPEEFSSGQILPERLTEIKLNMAKWRAMDGFGSIAGKTAIGEAEKQYKTWAIPQLQQVIHDSYSTFESIKNKENPLKNPDTVELIRASLTTAVIALVFMSYMKEREKERSLIDKFIHVSIREALSLIGVLDTSFWTASPRSAQFIADFGLALQQIITLQKTAGTGELVGVNSVQRILNPAAIRQFVISTEEKNRDFITSLYNNLKNMSPEERDAQFKKLPTEVKEKLKEFAKKKSMTKDELILNKLEIIGGYRATAIYKRLDKLDTPEEKESYINNLRKKGIVTPTVYKQLKELIENGEIKTKMDELIEKKKTSWLDLFGVGRAYAKEEVNVVTPPKQNMSVRVVDKEILKREMDQKLGPLKDNMLAKQLTYITKGEGSLYNPEDPKQTRPGKLRSDITGAYNRDVVRGSVAFGNRAFHKELKAGKKIYIYVQELKDVKTPYGLGIFRIDDTMNQSYDKEAMYNVDFHPKDLPDNLIRTGRFPIHFKITKVE